MFLLKKRLLSKRDGGPEVPVVSKKESAKKIAELEKEVERAKNLNKQLQEQVGPGREGSSRHPRSDRGGWWCGGGKLGLVTSGGGCGL